MDYSSKEYAIQVGCNVVLVGIFVAGFFFMARGLTFALSPALPLWASVLIGILFSLIYIAVIIVLPGDPPDKVVQFAVGMMFFFMLLPVVARYVTVSQQKKAPPTPTLPAPNQPS